MEGNTNWKPNEQGGDSFANNADDWRSQPDTSDLRKRVLSRIIEKLKVYFPKHSQQEIHRTAVQFEEKMYGIGKDEDDYLRNLTEKMNMVEKKHKDVQLSSSVNGTNTSTSQQRLPQNTHSSLNIPRSSGLSIQVPTTTSVYQNLNSQIGEGTHINPHSGSQIRIQGRQQPLAQQQPQNANYMFKQQMNQQILKEQIRHGNLQPSYMQQQAQPPQQQQHHQQSLFKHPFQQQLPHQTSLYTIQKSFPQSSALSGLPLSGIQTSMPRHQFLNQRVSSNHQQQMNVSSQEEKQLKQEQLISQLMNGLDTQHNHLTSRQSNRDQQGAFRVSSSQQNNIANYQAMAQHPQCLNNASAFPTQQQPNMPSLLGIQGQEVGQSQPMMSQIYLPQYPLQQQQQPQNRILHQHMNFVQNDTQTSQANQQNQSYHLQRASLANPSNSTGMTVNTSGGDWQEDTYQKIKALKEMYLPLLNTMREKIMEKLREDVSLPAQNMQSNQTERLKKAKLLIEQAMVYINVHRKNISETCRDKYSYFEDHILRLTRNHASLPKPSQQQQQQGQLLQPSQIHQTALNSQITQGRVSQSLVDKDHMNSSLMPSNQNVASSNVSGFPHSFQTRPKMEPRDENNIMVSSGNVVLPSLAQNPTSHPQIIRSDISSIHSNLFQQLQQQKTLHRQQQRQQPQQANQQLQMPTSASYQTNNMNDVQMRQMNDITSELLQQKFSLSQHQLLNPLASSYQIHNHSSPKLVDQQMHHATVNKTGSFVTPSPVSGDFEKPLYVESPTSYGVAIKPTLDSSVKPYMRGQSPVIVSPEPITERPIDRLIKALQSSSAESLAESVSEMSSVITLSDMVAGSYHPSVESFTYLDEDLSEGYLMTQEETNPSKRMKRSINTVLPQDITSQIDSYQYFSSLESEVDPIGSSGFKVNKNEHCALLKEIKEINEKLVETLVEICDADALGTIVTCSYVPVALSATFKDHYNSGKIIQPLRVLVPTNYPYSSPTFLNEIPIDASTVYNYEDLSARTRLRFTLSVKELSEPLSLKDISQTWNDCVRATMVEYAERHGGGTFSSKYGAWDNVLKAS